jgi:type IV secretory pathway component VirB8
VFGRKNQPNLALAPASEPDVVDKASRTPFDAALNWESTRINLVEKSEQRAWRVVTVLAICIVLLAVAIALMLPLKENTPYVIRVDNTTGVPDIVTAMDTKGVSFDEVMDKYWLAQYVRAHETYDWYTLQKDYDTVGLLSTARVGQEYAALFDGKGALDKTRCHRLELRCG